MGMDWRIGHDAFVAYAEEVLPDGPPPVRVLGIDETRRGKGRYEVVASTGVKVWVDRFDTGLVDLDGTGGLFAQVNGRNSAAVIAWLEEQDPGLAGGDHARPDGHLGDLRPRRPARAATRHGHCGSVPSGGYREPGGHRVPAGTGLVASWPAGPEGGPGVGAAEPVAPRRRVADRGGVGEAARRDARRGPLRRAREMLAGKGNAPRTTGLAGTDPDRSLIWRRLTDFYMHCADSEIHQLRRLAWTVNAWQPSIIQGILTGISNGRTEGYNRIVKHVGRIAFGFRNTENQKRRIRFACTRASRRPPTRTLKPR
jgi:hypothetical protein